jgi:hypothetical protein
MTFIFLFFIYLTIEMIAVMWTKSIVSHNIKMAMMLTGINHGLVALGVSFYFNDRWLIAAVISGAVTGVWIAMKESEWRPRRPIFQKLVQRLRSLI